MTPIEPGTQAPFDTIDLALQEIADGGMVIVVDDEDRENEGDLDHGRRARHAPTTSPSSGTPRAFCASH